MPPLGRPWFTDWTLGGGSGSPNFGNAIVADTPYRDTMDGSNQQIDTYIFAATIPVTSGKTVTSITLPSSTDNGSIGIFAIAAG